MTFSCPVVGGSSTISNLQSIFVNHIFPECSIPLHLPALVPSCATGVEVSSKDSATLPNDFLPGQLRSRSLSRLRGFWSINVDDPRYHLPSPPDVRSNDIFVSTSAQIRPLISHQAAPSLYRHPNTVSFSYFVCGMADPNTSIFSRWLMQAH